MLIIDGIIILFGGVQVLNEIHLYLDRGLVYTLKGGNTVRVKPR